ncbi:cytochrome P450 family protein [Paenibacillus bouchesdurhonensis]|uniref:cytochrome P450 family protein n=1 Tax=Paenibacillus bouchesdurhonensis TaxID=1870990 RepID=UPI000DA6066B|nr:cytochrome P450 [Paenibacillus bouchesdurhonensis]
MNHSNGVAPEKAVFSLFSGESGDNPFSLFAQLRGIGSVIPIPFPMGSTDRPAWMVTRMEEAMLVLKDHQLFTVDSSSIAGSHPMLSLADSADPASPPTFFTGKSMLTVDEPDHRRLRRLVSKAFTPRFIESLRPRVQKIADELIDLVQARGQMDLVTDYAYPLPINVISEMLGVPRADREQIQSWSAALAHGLGLGRREPGVDEHLRAFGEYTAQLVDIKRQQPGNDLISQLIAIEEEEDRLDEAELVSMITLLIFAGHETTSNLIATGSLMLLDHPEQLKKLQANLSLVPSAVEELLRFNGPATIAGPRFATEDIELAGQQIKKGDAVIVVLKSANRDEIPFAYPEELDITRKINRHLAFGHGIHMCLGAPLARMEGEIAFTTLLTRVPGIRLNMPREKVKWNFTLSSQGLTKLPVAF